MRIDRIRIKDFRNFESLEWVPRAGLNFLSGDNGAGKTSIIEAIHLLAYGRSFRGRVSDGLIRRGFSELEVFAQWRSGDRGHQAGLRHTGKRWEARLDGESVGALSELCRVLAVVTFEPGSQRLVSGSSDVRRRYLDWLLFHVEPDFLMLWRRWTRALKQRNALLKQQAASDSFAPWEHELGESGEALSKYRQSMLAHLERALQSICTLLVPELGVPRLTYQPGWRAEGGSLVAALARNRSREQQLGHT
ncbi:MAG: DNA replication and repair protein RecF, partial [Gammaproteobacteria bacterium HGW-Gammaproteobacteria-7]